MAQQVARVSPDGTKFWAYTPTSYDEDDPTGSPLLIALHGGSGIGDDLDILTTNKNANDRWHLTPARLIYQDRWNTDLPFVVISPQLKRDESIPNYNNQTWPVTIVDEVLEFVKDEYNIDETRIYLTGISLGGNGVWSYAANFPSKVTAIAPMSGVTDAGLACQLKDMPVWAFHGENDALVRPQFSIDMVNSILTCNPPGAYKAHLSLIPSRYHEGWNEIYDGSSTYDLYSWFLKFSKGDNSNKSPFVTAGGDRLIALPLSTFYVAGDYYDADGDVSNVVWTRVSGPAGVQLADANTRILKLTNLAAGTYVFRLTVTDDDGAQSSDEMTLVVHNSASGMVITDVILTNGDEVNIRSLTQDDVVNLSDLGTHRINIRAVTTGGAGSVRFSINAFNVVAANNTASNASLLRGDDWKPADETYLLCATPYSGTLGAGTSGYCTCYKITFGRKTYYAKPNSNFGQLSSWTENANGTGASPASLTAAPLNLIVPDNATVSTQTTLNGNSKVIVSPGSTLTLNALIVNDGGGGFTNMHAENNSTVRVTVDNATLGTLASESTVIMDGSAGYRFPTAIYGNLIFRGTAPWQPQNGASIVVLNELKVEPNVLLQNSGNNSAEFVVLGKFDMQSSSLPAVNRAFPIRFGGTNPVLNINAARVRFKSLTVQNDVVLSVLSPGSRVVEINSQNGDGHLTIENLGKLQLNGNQLDLKNTKGINPNNETGVIDFGGTSASLHPDVSGIFNLYPERGNHTFTTFEFTAPSGSELFVRDSLKVTDQLVVSGGTIHSNGYITLASTGQNHAASVAQLNGSATIVGNVNVERYVEPGRKWKYMSFPVTGMNVADLQDYVPVTGGFNGADTGPGLGVDASLYYYHEPSGGWIPYPAANSNNQQPLNLGTGYAVFMRNSTVAEKVIATGQLRVGQFQFTLTPDPDPNNEDDGWNLIGNPYASSIFWGTTGWTRSQVNQTVSIRDNDLGSFRVWDGETGDADNFDGVIASGQSMWVRTIGSNPQLTITEAAKAAADGTFFRTANDVSALRVKLTYDEHYDNAYIKFKPGGNPALDNERDAVKRKNDHINFAVLTSDGASVAIKNLSDTLCIHETALAFEPSSTGLHTIMVEGTAFTKTIAKLRLIDHYLDSTVTLAEGEEYTFSVTGEHKSAAKDRFSLWIETGNTPDPVITFTDGMLTTTGAKSVQWLLDGVEIPGATGLTLQPEAEGEYQVRMTKGGCTKTSEKFAFRITSTSPTTGEVAVYPNPARGHLNVAGVTNPGTSYSIISVTGTVVQQGTLSADAPLLIPTDHLAPGVYMLHLQDSKGLLRFRVVIQ